MKKMISLTVYWRTKEIGIIRKIRERFGLPSYMTVNGETDAEVSDEDFPLLEETARRGFIQIRKLNRIEEKSSANV